MPTLSPATPVRVLDDANLNDLYELGATSSVWQHGENTMRGQVLVGTIDPTAAPGFQRLLALDWYAPERLVPTEETTAPAGIPG